MDRTRRGVSHTPGRWDRGRGRVGGGDRSRLRRTS